MGKYISVPTEIEAVQWTGDNREEVDYFTSKKIFRSNFMVLAGIAWLYVAANNKWLTITKGEWVLKDSLGFYPCKDEIFKAKYREADDART